MGRRAQDISSPGTYSFGIHIPIASDIVYFEAPL